MSLPPESPAPPPWVGWIQTGLSSMLAVLFVVVLARSLEQGRTLRQLQTRLEALESSRSMDKAADQSGQLRTLTRRLEELESQSSERLERAEAERMRLQQLLVQLRERGSSPDPQPREAGSSGDPRPTPMPTPRATVLRPTPPPPIPQAP